MSIFTELTLSPEELVSRLDRTTGVKPQAACLAGSLIDPFFGSAYQQHAGALLRPAGKLADLLDVNTALPHFLKDTPDGSLAPGIFRKLLLHHQIYHRRDLLLFPYDSTGFRGSSIRGFRLKIIAELSGFWTSLFVEYAVL